MDSELALRAQSGDRAAFEALIERYSPLVHAVGDVATMPRCW